MKKRKPSNAFNLSFDPLGLFEISHILFLFMAVFKNEDIVKDFINIRKIDIDLGMAAVNDETKWVWTTDGYRFEMIIPSEKDKADPKFFEKVEINKMKDPDYFELRSIRGLEHMV